MGADCSLLHLEDVVLFEHDDDAFVRCLVELLVASRDLRLDNTTGVGRGAVTYVWDDAILCGWLLLNTTLTLGQTPSLSALRCWKRMVDNHRYRVSLCVQR